MVCGRRDKEGDQMVATITEKIFTVENISLTLSITNIALFIANSFQEVLMLKVRLRYAWQRAGLASP